MERTAFIRTQEAAIRAIRETMNEENRAAALAVISSYNESISQFNIKANEGESNNFKKLEAEVRLKAYEAESQYIAKLVKEKRINRELAYLSQEYVRRMELAVTNRMRYGALVIWVLLKRVFLQFIHIFSPNKEEQRNKRNSNHKKIFQLKKEMALIAIQELKSGLNSTNKHISYIIIGEYNKLITRINHVQNITTAKTFSRMERELQDKAFQAERYEIQNLYEKGVISIDITRNIRKQINLREAYWMEENSLHS